VSARRRERSRGQSLVEFAFIFPIITLLAFSAIDIGRAVFAYNTLTNAAREGARVAAVNQLDPIDGPWDCMATHPVEDVNNPSWTFRGCVLLSAKTLGVEAGDVTISYAPPPGSTITCSGPLTVGCIATVTVVSDFVPITPVAGSVIGPIAMSSTSSMPVERIFP